MAGLSSFASAPSALQPLGPLGDTLNDYLFVNGCSLRHRNPALQQLTAHVAQHPALLVRVYYAFGGAHLNA